jgi:hypothetical protein
MLLIRIRHGDGPGTVHVFNAADSIMQWSALCGRRAAKSRSGPFEQDVPDARPSHIEITCYRCRNLVRLGEAIVANGRTPMERPPHP